MPIRTIFKIYNDINLMRKYGITVCRELWAEIARNIWK